MEREDFKESYERAIKAREYHYSNFNYWINFYAIVIGALFVGYYNVDDYILKMIIAAIGVVASFAWLQSFRGYYHWIKQWIEVVQFHEGQYISALCDENDSIQKEKDADNLRVYSLYYESDSEKACCLLQSKNISTQKMTLRLILCLLLAWIGLLFYSCYLLIGKHFSVICAEECQCRCVASCCILVLLIIIGLFIVLELFTRCNESDTSNHYRLTGRIDHHTVIPPKNANQNKPNK